jgi:hypothetical protein
MVKYVRKFWKSVKRNPVINAFVIACATQIAHDYLANQIDWTNVVGYLAMVLIGVATREFTVPLSTHHDLQAKVSQAIVEGLGQSDRNAH